MDALELDAIQDEVEALQVSGHVAGIGHDLLGSGRRNEPSLVFLEVPIVVERQAGARLLEHPDRVLGRQLALGVEVVFRRLGRG